MVVLSEKIQQETAIVITLSNVGEEILMGSKST